MTRCVKLFPALLALVAACGGGEGGGSADDEDAPKRTLSKPRQEFAASFAQTVVNKDYKAAYGMMSTYYRNNLSYEEFLESITRYRDSVPGKLEVKIRASDDDPKSLPEDAMVQLLVHDEKVRTSILDEFILDFRTEDEGFWVLVGWIVEEEGKLKILNYYQDD